MNSITITGRLVADPELKSTQGGKSWTKFRICHSVHTQNGEKTHFFNVTSFGKSADFISANIRKGDKVVINGSLQANEWNDKEGKKKTEVSINCRSIEPIKKINQHENRDFNSGSSYQNFAPSEVNF